MLVQQFLETAAAQRPEKTALVCGEQRWTYQQLDEAANRLAHALQSTGVQRGDRVTILLENSAEAVIAIFAALKAGGTFMVLHPGTKPEKLTRLLEDAEPAALVTDAARVRDALHVVAAAPSLRCLVWADDAPLALHGRLRSLGWSELRAFSAERPACTSIDADLATLIYTSGSTGQPKGVMSTHLNMVTATTSINGYLQNTPEDVILDVLPLAFDYGLYQVMLAFQVCARLVLEKSFAFPTRTVALLEREQVSGLPGVPTLFALLFRYPGLLRRELPALRYITNTGAPLPTSYIERLRATFPQARLFSMYGLTECKRVSYLPPDELDRRPTSVGVAIPNTEVWVAGEKGQRLPPGEVGELVVRGSHVTRGYWRAPELTAHRFRPGPIAGETVLYTGDLFKTDADGFLYFVARKDDVIKTRGEKVGPREVEEAVCRLPGVAEAAVIGVPDSLLGQAISLVVAPLDGAPLTERDIRAHCARSLDGFMQPKYVTIVAGLPHTENGKVDKARIAREILPCAVS